MKTLMKKIRTNFESFSASIDVCDEDLCINLVGEFVTDQHSVKLFRSVTVLNGRTVCDEITVQTSDNVTEIITKTSRPVLLTNAYINKIIETYK